MIADDRPIAEKCFHIITDNRWQRFQRSGDHMETRLQLVLCAGRSLATPTLLRPEQKLTKPIKYIREVESEELVPYYTKIGR